MIRSSIARSFRLLFASGFLTLAFAGPGFGQLGFVRENARISDGEPGFPAGLITTGDRFGEAVADASDLDGNGYRDLVVGAPGVDTNFTDPGEVFLVQLLSKGGIQSVTSLDFAYATNLAAGDGFGSSVARVSDMSVDGIDIVVGAPGDDTGGTDAGAVWIVRLGPNLSEGNSAKIANGLSGFPVPLNASDGFGTAVAAMGDLDGNDIGDLVVTAPGRDFGQTATDRGAAYFVFLDGQNQVASTLELSFHQLAGSADSDFIGASVTTIGDLNGDSFNDIAVGAPLDDTGGTDTGAVYLLLLDGAGGLLGQRKIASGDPDLANFGVELFAGDRFGSSLSASDLNGDGQVELFVGADQTDGKGAVWLLSLTSTGLVNRGRKLGAGPGDAFFDTPQGQRFGAGVAAMGDVDTNGIGDVVIGHPQNAANFPGPGAVWLAMLGTCGDGVVDVDEQCDDGDPSGNDCCTANCVVKEDFASCDDGNECIVGEICTAGVCGSGLEAADGNPCSDGKVCTTMDSCLAGECIGQGVDCSFLDGACEVGVCNATDGMCDVSALPDFQECDDGNPCTQEDFCTSGVCAGSPTDCSAFDNNCNVGTCDAMTGACALTPKANGTECLDDNACTTSDQCTDGECGGSATDCSAFANACNTGVCDTVTGECSAAPTMDGTPCDDGDPCTVGDQCAAGVCAGSAKDCSAAGDQCNDGVCNAGTGACEPAPKPNGISCSDGDACTEFDQCTGGFCQASQKDCSAFADACNIGRCDGLSGNCFADPNQENPSCDDGDSCTVNDQCDAGVCAGAPKDCSAAGDQCNDGICIEATGACGSEPTENGTACDDGNPCTVNDQCSFGVCTGTAKDCSAAGDQCNDGVCNAGTGACEPAPKPNGISCSDGDACTEFDQCSGGACAATPKDCSAFNDACNLGSCDAMTGSCVATPNLSNPPCDDGNPCTENDQCAVGVCAGAAKDCSAAGDQCNDGTCNAGSGACEPTPKSNGTVCSDGDVCTEGDQCSGGACEATSKDCSAFDDACNEGACDPMTGVCEASPGADGTPCDDGNPCTENDQCAAGVCAGAAKDCSAAGDQCNDGICNAGTGACEASPTADGTSCDDGNLCTQVDECSAGSCMGSAKDCSDESDACNDAACNVATGACDLSAKSDGTPCSDDNLCTLQDQCSGGTCDGAPLDCSHLDQGCIVGVCNGDSGGCVTTDAPANMPCDDGIECTSEDVCLFGSCAGTNVANGTECSDDDPCTVNEQCVAGECSGSAKDCSAESDQCNDGVCNAVTGACEASSRQAGTACDDGAPCTVADQCTGGTCAGEPTDCSGSVDQCNAAACNQVTGVCDVVPKTIGTPCDDADPCTENDQCGSGLCGGSPRNCSAFSDQCNTGTCNPVDGSCFATPTLNGGPCEDTSFCTADDTCIDGLCIGGGNPCTGKPTCEAVCNEDLDLCAAAAGTVCADDGNVCTDDVCNGSGGCGVSNQAACDDGLFCTKDDTCSEGLCGGAATCPQTAECTDTCNEDEDVCRRCGSPFSNTRCVVNAVFVLQGALGLRGCELCTCDVNASSTVTVSDALAILMTCANLPTTLSCESAEPLPEPLPTTARPSTTSTTMPEVE